MEYILMCKDNEVLDFDLDESKICILNPQLLPYSLKDYITDSSDCSIKDLFKYLSQIRAFFADRTLSLSRSNAKTLLNLAQAPQKLNDESRFNLSMSCRGISMIDSYWIKKPGENMRFEDIDIRRRSLSDVVFPVAMLGKHMTIERALLDPELTTEGMFPKAWMRLNDEVYLVKSDKTSEKVNVDAEVKVSAMLDKSNVPHVVYRRNTIQNTPVSMCKCITTEDIALVEMDQIHAWCAHTNRNFLEFVKQIVPQNFAKMVVCDYIFANTDRHINNWGLLIDPNSNEILTMAPLYDHNQALVADELGTPQEVLNDLIYEPTGQKFLESAKEYYEIADFKIDENELPEKVLRRLETLKKS